MQQIALFRNKEILSPSKLSTIQRANDSNIDYGRNELMDYWQNPTQGDVMRGVLSSNISAFSPTCPSSKCTWEEFDTLAVCSKCVDLTEHVMHKGCCRWNPKTGYNSTPGISETCTYTINGQTIENSQVFNSSGVLVPLMILSPFMVLPGDEVAPVEYIAGWEQPAFGVHRLLLDQADLNSPHVQQAQKCALRYCITRHNATMVGSALQVEWSTHAFASIADIYNIKGAALTWRSPTSNHALNDTITGKYEGYDIKYYTAGGMGAWYLGLALSSILIGQTSNETATGLIVYDSLMGYEVYATTDFPALMDRVATSLTQVMLADPGTSQTITGKARSVVSILYMRWEWISLPAVLLATSLAFLLLTMLISRRRRSFTWKTSSLPLLFHGIESPEDRWATLGTISQMDHEADKTEVRLGGVYGSKENPSPGWRLIASRETDTDGSKLKALGTRTDTPSLPGPKQHDTSRVRP